MTEKLKLLGHPSMTPPLPGSEAFSSLSALNGEGFQVYQGIDIVFVDQLIQKSLEPHVQATTPRDGAERFRDYDHFLEWHHSSPGRTFFVMTASRELAGAAWFTPSKEETALAGQNFAIRLYNGYAGRGLARHFMAVTHGRMVFLDRQVSLQGIALEADSENKPALAAYRRFGYKAVEAATTSQKRIRMLLSSERLLEIITSKSESGD